MSLHIQPPLAKKVPKIKKIHDDTLIDNYGWLMEKDSPDVMKYLSEENKYTEKKTEHTRSFKEILYREIRSKIKEDDITAPLKKGKYYYYKQTKQGLQYPVYCRYPEKMPEKVEILVDLNDYAKDYDYVSLGTFSTSDDGTMLAYSMDTKGYREYLFYLKDLVTNTHLKENLGYVGSMVWSSDGKAVFYTREDETKRPFKVFVHIIGTAPSKDRMIFEEKNRLFRVYLYSSRDRKYLFVKTESFEQSEVLFLDRSNYEGELKVIIPREKKHRYDVDHRNKTFWFRTNRDTVNFRVVSAPTESPNAWEEVIPHRLDTNVESLSIFKDFMVVSERKEGLAYLKVLDYENGDVQKINFPDPLYEVEIEDSLEYETKVVRYNYESYTCPETVFEYCPVIKKTEILKTIEIVGGYSPSDYVIERRWATSYDGEKIPISLVYKKGVKKKKPAPLWLYGYGSYGISLPHYFSVARLALLDRGVIYAQAHVRGGGDFGEAWHEKGKMENKKNSFFDFISVADFLVNSGYTYHAKMVIQGGSAGGLLIGAVLNSRPDICHAAHLAVPFVDVLNTMLNDKLPLTIGEYVEWGNPRNKDVYDYIKSYCPYTNLATKSYPNILVTSSLYDSQVMYWEPAKYVARLRDVKMGTNDVMLKMSMNSGHSGSSGRFDSIKDVAFEYSVLLSLLGINT